MDLEWYDLFISYRHGRYDSKFTEELSTSLVSYNCIGKTKRSIRCFLDNESLPIGFDFQLKFVSSLLSSVLALPIVSYESLLRMKKHTSNTSIDNLMLEWIITIICTTDNIKSSPIVRLQQICPIIIGRESNGEIKIYFKVILLHLFRQFLRLNLLLK